MGALVILTPLKPHPLLTARVAARTASNKAQRRAHRCQLSSQLARRVSSGRRLGRRALLQALARLLQRRQLSRQARHTCLSRIARALLGSRAGSVRSLRLMLGTQRRQSGLQWQ